jgi:signal transduction histidine kinase
MAAPGGEWLSTINREMTSPEAHPAVTSERAVDRALRRLAELDGLEAEMRAIAEAIQEVTGAQRLALYAITEREGNSARRPRLLVALDGNADEPPGEDLVDRLFSQWPKRRTFVASAEGYARAYPIRYRSVCAGAVVIVRDGPFWGAADGPDLPSLLSLAALTIAKHWFQAEGHRRLAELKALHGLGQVTSSGLSVEGILDDVFETAAQIIEYDTAALFVVDEEEHCLRMIASRNIAPEVAQKSKFPIGQGIVGWVVAQERPLAVPDTRRDPRFILAPGLGRRRAHSLLVVPLRMRGEVIAALSFSRHRANAFTQHDLELAEVVAAYAAQALEHARLSRSAAEAESLRQGTELLTSLAHDVRAPLNLIRYVVEILREEFPEAGSQQLDLFDQVAVASRQLSQLVNTVLETSRLESSLLALTPEPVDLARLAEQVSLSLGWRKTPKHSLQVTIPEGLIVQADSIQLYRMLANLVDNALKYSPEGGTVVIGGRSAEGGVELTVTDEGIGIEPDKRTHLFERFQRATDVASRDSFGLGLYTCRRIVEAHGGRVEVVSEPGRGSTFTVYLPLVANQPSELGLVG